VLPCEAKRPAYDVHDSGAIPFLSWSPILFGGREQQSQQIGRAGEQAVTHSDAKRRALQYSNIARLGRRQSARDLRGKFSNRPVRSYARFKVRRQVGAQHVRSKAQPQAQDSLGAGLAGYRHHAIPIQCGCVL